MKTRWTITWDPVAGVADLEGGRMGGYRLRMPIGTVALEVAPEYWLDAKDEEDDGDTGSLFLVGFVEAGSAAWDRDSGALVGGYFDRCDAMEAGAKFAEIMGWLRKSEGVMEWEILDVDPKLPQDRFKHPKRKEKANGNPDSNNAGE